MEYDIDALYYNAVDLLKEMIETPSFSREEHNVAEIIAAYMRKMGFEPQRKGNNLWIQSKDFEESKPTILLNSHMDTVRPVSGWTKDPFTPETEDDTLYGLGSNDAGAPFVCLLHAFFVLTAKKQDYNLIFLASCEEEISGKDGAESVVPLLPEIEFGIVGEPTQMNPAIAEKGLLVLDCTAYGKAGHAARDEGENAIYKAMKDIEWFRTYQFPKVSELLGPVKMTVSMINAGTQHNVVPDKCDFVVDVRSNELYSNQELFGLIDDQTSCEIKPRSFRLNSSRIALENPFVQRAIIIGKEPYGSPTLSDQTFMPFPTLKMGPGDSARSHTANEYILLSEIREGIELYIKLLDGLRL
ncbi:M20 family metallo-hydrolase [Prevotella sp. 10(H)]|uniref:M20 family metallo-hydrolase n=1 Tax=Prevotella sp. 10(H) TaxID=1158294 RepID=UPI0004A730C1|nr:M20 family metallo-hydrolase [Prevotella sp. 10(H)]